jgi:hypothetical protein
MMGLTLEKTPDIGVLQVTHNVFIRILFAGRQRPVGVRHDVFLNTDPVLQEIAANAVLRHYLEFSQDSR